MDKEYTCFFTGHRLIPPYRAEMLRRAIELKAKYLIEEKGVENFIAGGALGFDTLAAEAIIKLKKEYPYIKLYLYLPCVDQSSKWRDEDRYKWRMMMSKVDNYIYISKSKYFPGCMQKRNKKMADDSQYCIAYCIQSRSGTAATIKYAQAIGTSIENIAETIYE